MWTMAILSRDPARHLISDQASPCPPCPPQVAYAAHDAWLSREVLLELFRINQHKQSQHRQDCERSSPPERVMGHQSQLSAPPPPLSGEITEDIRTFTSAFLDVFNGIKPKRMDKALGELGSAAGAAGGARRRAAEAAVSGRVVKAAGIVRGAAPRAISDGQGQEGSGGGSRRRKERKLPTRKSVLYENCRLLVGRLMVAVLGSALVALSGWNKCRRRRD